MSSHQNWVEALNISPETLAQWSAQAPGGTPLLVWCLEQGHIPVDSYFKWAQETFEVPVLSSSFFSDAFDAAFVASARNSGNWYPWQYPVHSWEGVTLVACVEVPPQEEWGEFRFVLADPRVMREAWGTTGVHKVETTSEGPPPLESLEAPIGISINATKPFKLNLDLGALDMPSEESVAAPPQPPPKANLIQELPSQVSIHIDEPSVVAVPTETAPGMKQAPPTPIKPATASHAAGSKREPTAAELKAIKELFAKLGQKFKGALIMKCSDTNATIRHWDDKLKVNSGHPSMNMNLSYPTFLRIVAKTMMPYHGYLMESSAHRDFFQALGFEDLPPCVTAIPLKNDGHLWGIVVAVGGEENQKMDSLTYAQEHTDHLLATAGEEWIKAS